MTLWLTVAVAAAVGAVVGGVVALLVERALSAGAVAREVRLSREAREDTLRASQQVRLAVVDIERVAKRALSRAQRTLTPEQTAIIVTDHNKAMQDVAAMKVQLDEVLRAARNGELADMVGGVR